MRRFVNFHIVENTRGDAMISAVLQNGGGKCLNVRIFVKHRGEMRPVPHCHKYQRRFINFRIFTEQRGENA
jgi:hypothetical protein